LYKNAFRQLILYKTVQKYMSLDKSIRGRPRRYERDAALSDAMNTFWQRGYSGTSLDMLGTAMAMNRPSLYAAFGDKHGLYLTVLERYAAEGLAAMHNALFSGHSLRDALMSVYNASLDLYFGNEGDSARGCFLIGTAATEAQADEEVQHKLKAALASFDAEFEARIVRAQAEGEIDSAIDSKLLAQIASSILHSLAVRSRAGDSKESLCRLATKGCDMICNVL
jgi:AcrR family transcriptional regulator